MLLISQMFERGITPSVISRGNMIMNMCIEEYNINFSDTFLYIKASLSKCCSLYNLTLKKGCFPLAANTETYYDEKKIPPLKLFIGDGDSKKVIEEKTKWYNSRRKRPWIFKTEICMQN